MAGEVGQPPRGVSTLIGGTALGLHGRASCARSEPVRPARRFVKTEIVLPASPVGRAAVITALAVGGTVAIVMVALFVAFVFETVRTMR